MYMLTKKCTSTHVLRGSHSTDWMLVQKEKECAGSEVDKGDLTTAQGCADACRYKCHELSNE